MRSYPMSWVNPTTDTDNNPYAQGDNAGYMIAIDGQPAVSIPLTWGTSFDLAQLAAVQSLKSGQHTAQLALISSPAKGGVTGLFTAPVTFPVYPTPNAPSNLSIS